MEDLRGTKSQEAKEPGNGGRGSRRYNFLWKRELRTRSRSFILGIFQPYAAWRRTKYNPEGGYKLASKLITSNLITYDANLAVEARKCILASLSRRTWEKYNSAWNAFRKFECSLEKLFTWPLPEVAYRGFATWCIRVRKLTAATTRAYITALSTAHTLAGLEDSVVKPGKLTHHILAGGRNLEVASNNQLSTRRTMSLTVLKILGHRLATSKWSAGSKQVVWSAATTAFFTSARMGELLSPDDSFFDPTTTLLWEQLTSEGTVEFFCTSDHRKFQRKKGIFWTFSPSKTKLAVL